MLPNGGTAICLSRSLGFPAQCPTSKACSPRTLALPKTNFSVLDKSFGLQASRMVTRQRSLLSRPKVTTAARELKEIALAVRSRECENTNETFVYIVG